MQRRKLTCRRGSCYKQGSALELRGDKLRNKLSLHPNILYVSLVEHFSKLLHPSPLIPTRRARTRIAPYYPTVHLRDRSVEDMLQEHRTDTSSLICGIASALPEPRSLHLDVAGTRRRVVRRWQRVNEDRDDRDRGGRVGEKGAAVISRGIFRQEDVRHRFIWPEHGMPERYSLIRAYATNSWRKGVSLVPYGGMHLTSTHRHRPS